VILEPAGALAAGPKRYVEQHPPRPRLVAINSGANMNFRRLRHVTERAESATPQALIAAQIPERPGAFLAFCQALGARNITEFNYRYAPAETARIFVGVSLQRGLPEADEILATLRGHGYPVLDLSGNELAKLHVRHMVGGQVPASPTFVPVRVSPTAGRTARVLRSANAGTSACSTIAITARLRACARRRAGRAATAPSRASHHARLRVPGPRPITRPTASLERGVNRACCFFGCRLRRLRRSAAEKAACPYFGVDVLDLRRLREAVEAAQLGLDRLVLGAAFARGRKPAAVLGRIAIGVAIAVELVAVEAPIELRQLEQPVVQPPRVGTALAQQEQGRGDELVDFGLELHLEQVWFLRRAFQA
jgi:hypothetical protein